jgi:hypothetical protein
MNKKESNLIFEAYKSKILLTELTMDQVKARFHSKAYMNTFDSKFDQRIMNIFVSL